MLSNTHQPSPTQCTADISTPAGFLHAVRAECAEWIESAVDSSAGPIAEEVLNGLKAMKQQALAERRMGQAKIVALDLLEDVASAMDDVRIDMGDT